MIRCKFGSYTSCLAGRRGCFYQFYCFYLFLSVSICFICFFLFEYVPICNICFYMFLYLYYLFLCVLMCFYVFYLFLSASSTDWLKCFCAYRLKCSKLQVGQRHLFFEHRNANKYQTSQELSKFSKKNCQY